MLISTTKGLVDRESLDVKLIERWTDNSHDIATEFYLGGELVRRDVTVSVLRGLSMGSEQESL